MTTDVHIFRVEGMTCNHCKATVEKGLKGLPMVTEAVADPEKNQVTVQAAGISEPGIRETIERLGYTFGGKL